MANRSPQLTRNVKQRVLYKDITPNLDRRPVSGELEILTNAAAVAQSIRNCVLTLLTERYYNPLFGSTVNDDLFEFADDFTMGRVKTTITNTITTWEPRAQNLNVVVTGDGPNHKMIVNIYFTIVLVPSQVFSVQPIVLKVR